MLAHQVNTWQAISEINRQCRKLASKWTSKQS